MSLGRRAGIEVIWTGEIDLVAYTREAALAVVDVKSAASSHTPLYALRADQLTSYQMLLEAHGKALGIAPVQKLGFWDFLKRKAARIEPPVLVPTRSAEELAEFRDKVFWLAQDIVGGRFPRASRMQYNTPCELCDYARFCIDGDEEGLLFEGKAPKKPAALAASAAA
jgi:hypothetical protein